MISKFINYISTFVPFSRMEQKTWRTFWSRGMHVECSYGTFPWHSAQQLNRNANDFQLKYIGIYWNYRLL